MAAANFRKMENYDPQHLIKFLKFSLCMGVYEKDLLTEVFSDNVAKKLITSR